MDSAPELATVLEPLAASAQVALDCEADSLHAYPEKLCLIQLAAGEGEDPFVALLDPLAELDVQPLLKVLACKRLLLHGADFDLRLLHRSYGFTPTKLFDTMEAARLLGWREVSLKAIIARILGHRLDKGSQRANWGRRPLTAKMHAYAIDDVKYLAPVAAHLEAELTSCGRLSWHQEICQRLIKLAAAPRVVDETRVWRVKGSKSLGRLGLAALRELWHVREREAVTVSRPPYFVFAHEFLVDLAGQVERDPTLTGQKLVQRARLGGRRARAIADALDRARDLPASQHPQRLRSNHKPQLSSAEQARLVALKEVRDRQAQQLEIEPTLIAPKAVLIALARERVPPHLMKWQHELLGL
ncbi:MAG: ribonuclease D [Nannocystaceae bacterium]